MVATARRASFDLSLHLHSTAFAERSEGKAAAPKLFERRRASSFAVWWLRLGMPASIFHYIYILQPSPAKRSGRLPRRSSLSAGGLRRSLYGGYGSACQLRSFITFTFYRRSPLISVSRIFPRPYASAPFRAVRRSLLRTIAAPTLAPCSANPIRPSRSPGRAHYRWPWLP
jgi:hypothetical protein